jgi:hypothetical protein
MIHCFFLQPGRIYNFMNLIDTYRAANEPSRAEFELFWTCSNFFYCDRTWLESSRISKISVRGSAHQGFLRFKLGLNSLPIFEMNELELSSSSVFSFVSETSNTAIL